jgi:hypothetical protein
MMKERFKQSEMWCKIGLLFIFGGFYVFAIPYPEKSRQFPQLLATVSLILTVISLISDFRRKEATSTEIGDVDDTELRTFDDDTKRLRKQRLYKAWAIILVSMAAGFLGGFLFCTFFLFVGFAWFFGPRERLVRNLVVGVVLTAFVYLVFQKLMAVPLLDGMLW